MAAPVDRVRLLKNESPGTGGTEDDGGFPAQLDANEDAPEMQGWFLQPPSPSTTKDELVYARRDASGNLIFRDNVDATERTLSALLTGGMGITEGQHDALDDLVHNIAETSYEEVTRSGGKVTNITIWETSSKIKKVRETIIARSGGKVSQIDLVQYDGTGTEKQRMAGVITRSDGKVASIAWTETGN